jgi:hypothetical protein
MILGKERYCFAFRTQKKFGVINGNNCITPTNMWHYEAK